MHFGLETDEERELITESDAEFYPCNDGQMGRSLMLGKIFLTQSVRFYSLDKAFMNWSCDGELGQFSHDKSNCLSLSLSQ